MGVAAAVQVLVGLPEDVGANTWVGLRQRGSEGHHVGGWVGWGSHDCMIELTLRHCFRNSFGGGLKRRLPQI